MAALMSRQGVPAGRRLGILTNAGGAAILAADAAEAAGLSVPVLHDATSRRCPTRLPPAASVGNPVDMLASATAADYGRSLRLLLADPGIDSVLAIYVPPLVTTPAEVATVIAAAANGAPRSRWRRCSCRRQVCRPSSGRCRRSDSPSPERGRWPGRPATAPGAGGRRARWRICGSPTPPVPSSIGRWPPAGLAVGRGRRRRTRRAGITVVRSVPATDLPAAVAAAGAIGYPVALKAVGATILHKSDVGGVRLDLRDGEAVAEAATAMQKSLGSRLAGYLVQPMVAPGVELLVGTVEDPSFGPVVLCSLGGTLVELLDAPSARLAPLSNEDVEELIGAMPGSAILRGYRGAPPADREAIADLLRRVSALVTRCPEILEMDLNPVRVFSEGLTVVDARIRIGAPPVASGRRIA